MDFFKNLFSGAANKMIAGTIAPAIIGFLMDLLKMVPGATGQMTVKDFITLIVGAIISGLAVYITPNKKPV
jgi:uncharacterized membrane protein